MKARRFISIASRAAAAAAILIAGLCGMGCNSAKEDNPAQMTSYSAGQTPGESASLFTVPQEQMSHIQIVPVQKTRLPHVLRLTGSVTFNAFKTTPVFASVGGPVHEILVTPGETVHAGQPLLTVNSPDYSQLRSAYLKARDAFQLADRNFTRAQDLYAHKAIAERDLQLAESARNQAQADVQSSEMALRALGLRDPEALLKSPVSGTIPLLAPVSGEVTDRMVGPGQLLQAGGTQCFTISDTSSVWVLVNVYQGDLAAVVQGDQVEITSDSYPETFHGRISYISPAMDPNTRTLQARIVTDNPGRKLKNNMYVSALVQAGAISDALVVPDAAVLHDTENQPFVYVQVENANKFARRVVTLGESRDGRTQIKSGLKEGERVVDDGSIFLQFRNSLQH
jgi:cobalt-zinc-cadmium efflux system membrane fusion protein